MYKRKIKMMHTRVWQLISEGMRVRQLAASRVSD